MKFSKSYLKEVLNLPGYVIEDYQVSESDKTLTIYLRPYKNAEKCCPICHQPCPGYDRGTPDRKWRHIDLNGYRCFLVMSLSRIECPEHGVHRMEVSFARAGTSFTYEFENAVVKAYRQLSKNMISELFQISYQSVGRILSNASKGQEK